MIPDVDAGHKMFYRLVLGRPFDDVLFRRAKHAVINKLDFYIGQFSSLSQRCNIALCPYIFGPHTQKPLQTQKLFLAKALGKG